MGDAQKDIMVDPAMVASMANAGNLPETLLDSCNLTDTVESIDQYGNA